MTTEHLLNIREAAEYLGIGERKIKEMVDSGELPAYKIGGSFLRFKESQLVITKSALQKKMNRLSPLKRRSSAKNPLGDSVLDFIYFNDFYIFSAVVVAIAIVLMIIT